ncbi:type I polyketide synthase [Streptomyces yunnanensis]|uniref:Acyl transferase domain-containing protein n=1 Tax=Streptomyces yunnanensis TaxID=156453 RepID=A0A9X8QUQ9_9ACTN|nr:type I polyketide synthase [Streptomyces yunnanensis]SHM26382.1 Acyl transferase domain-containing protein [Streptomyces yunnanensis]
MSTETILGVSPFGEPDPRLVAAVCRAGGLGVLDLGRGRRRAARAALQLVRQWVPGPFGVRVGAGCALGPEDLAANGGVHTVLLDADAGLGPGDLAAGRHRVLAEVTGYEEALAAARAGAHGLVARGNEAGGRVGELSTFVLLQQLVADPELGLPVWACGGIGPHTAAAAVVGGAAGVVLDTQLALLDESGVPEEVATAVRAMDGSETVVAAGHRVLRRRGPDAPPLPDEPSEVARLLGAEDPRTRLLPVGQDGFLASSFARRWGDVVTAVRGVTAAIREAVRDDAAADALLRRSPMSRALGTALPIAQGPMTRVSDRAGFAAAVAGHGGLPFLALALAGPVETRTLLEQTRDELGGRPWGVGILGFAPVQIKTAQLELVRKIRPSCALIAGGRPAQAAELEAAGVDAFLHVPSPGLLRQFLDAGARKFVFEGSECGGHVGPRSSFALWEAQAEVLEEFLDTVEGADPAELRVFFAGGVHDKRSAAMVAALAAPLTARGVAVGLLMGTAYLFTEEAVNRGAVRPSFQRQVLAARRTELLETAPGHVTRCVSSPFTDEFRGAKEELRERGVPERQAWERLEQLNVGRLRIASKGVERTGESLTEVDEPRQLTEGMFMAGQVAVLRSAATTVPELHAAVSAEAAGFFAARARRLREGFPQDAPERVPAPLDIAVVGMACMFPGAPDLATYWANVVAGTDAVGEVPPERWDPELHYAPDADGARTASKWGGFLPDIPFDPLRYGIPPSSLGSIEPVQLLALEAARRALRDAGYEERPFDRSRASVVFGAEAGSDLSNATTVRTVLPAYVGELPPGLDEQLPRLTEDSFPGMLANVIAGRIANRLDLGGANLTVDAACASSLAAVDVACKELSAGTSDLVLCGGADLHNGINDYVLFSSVHALSPTGRSRTFDSAADGIALGEGVACVVLKRLADAERDGDRVYAVVKGVGSSSDGRSLGLTAPRPEGQRAALERAYRHAGISPAEVGLLEAHGTGTVVGDRTELTTLTEVFTEAGAVPGGCALGSVKSQIGHTKCAAGLAGLIKTALALHTGVRPPTAQLTRPNPAWEAESSPFAFHTVARPWAAATGERVAGVSAFGFGGTNFHVVLRGHEAGPPPRHGLDAWPAELFVFHGADRAEAAREIGRLLELVAENDRQGRSWRLRDLALSAARRADASGKPAWTAVVARDLDELPGLLGRAREGQHDPRTGVYGAGPDEPDRSDGSDGEVAFLFPGQGSQRPDMLAELFIAFPEVQRYLRAGREWADVIFPPTAFDPGVEEAQRARVTDTRTAQPALGVMGLTVSELLGRAGVRPATVAGHSYGELVALCAAGAFDPETLLELSAARAEAILAAAGAEPGTMAAVAAGHQDVAEELRAAGLAGRVVVANHNAPRQTVISGPVEEVGAAVCRLRERGLGAKTVPVACAFHSPLVAPAGERFAEVLATRHVTVPEIPVWANRTAAVHPGHPDGIRAELAAQIGSPVRFAQQIEQMYEAGVRIFVEAGPGSVLTGLVGRILGDRPHTAAGCEGPEGPGLRGFLGLLARLAVAGVPVRTGWTHRGRDSVEAVPGTCPAAPGWTVNGQLTRTRDGGLLPGSLAPARRIPMEEMTVTRAQDGGTADDRDRMVHEFLCTSRELVAAQRDVLLTYLGGAADVPPVAPTPVPTVLPPGALRPGVLPPAAPEPAPVAAPVTSPAAAPTAPANVLATVLDIISERTGYPLDMIEPGLDLEADLSIDSIKRVEIVGELAARLGFGAGGTELPRLDDAELEAVSKARTASGIAGLLEERLPGGGTTPAQRIPAPAEDPDPAVTGEAPGRLVLRSVRLPSPDGDFAVLEGTRFALLGGAGPVPDALATLLGARGAEAVALPSDHVLTDTDGPLDGVFHLEALSQDGGGPLLPESFPVFQAALRCGPRWLLAAAPAADADVHAGTGGRADGLRGMFRTVAREYPDTLARFVELAPQLTAAEMAAALVGELTAEEPAPVVLRSLDGVRSGLETTAASLGALGDRGAGPAGDGTAEAAAIGLHRDSVVLLIGGARGISARVAATLAAASRCRIELAGRTNLPDAPEGAATRQAPDRAALRAALTDGVLSKQRERSPAGIEREVSEILARREVRRTLGTLRDLGSPVRYHTVDVRDPEAVQRLVADVHAEHGRLDGVVYAAGIIEDRVLAEKDHDSFRRVYTTKVDGARTLLAALDELPRTPRFVVFFGSVAAVLGNRGQADYAAANDALQSLGRRWAEKSTSRTLTVHWGPWAPDGEHAGMVTPELAREYARRGVGLIDPEEGALCLLRELAWGEESADAVVYTATGW